MNAFALSGRICGGQPTQGDALGYALVAPSGRALNACIHTFIQKSCTGISAWSQKSGILKREGKDNDGMWVVVIQNI